MLQRMMRHAVSKGSLRVILPNGSIEDYGGGGGPEVTLRIKYRALIWRIIASPSLGLGEGYMKGDFILEKGTLRELLQVMTSNLEAFDRLFLSRVRDGIARRLRRLRQFNPVRTARRNVAHHYDLSEALYRLFLDQDLQYSCAYFKTPADDLETAQWRKKQHLASKLDLRAGLTVLDLGCGWGGLALDLATQSKVAVTGVTLSQEQLRVARQRAKAAGLEDLVDFTLQDYRDIGERYDRIVSVGMFEHVGAPHFPEFFRKIEALLNPGGVALLHFIGRMGPPGGSDPWIHKYIFPGGYCPSLSEVSSAIEGTGLWVTDVEVLRLHYADTLAAWSARFKDNRAEISTLYDERFCRMWEFYLAACEMGFRNGRLVVYQIQLSNTPVGVPLTRDYMFQDELRRLAEGQQTAVG